MPRVFRIDEPYLFFGGNNKCLDPQVGLLNYGPHGGSAGQEQETTTIRAGIVGTDRSIDITGGWLKRLRYQISAEERSDTEYKSIDFPGLRLDSPLRFEITIDPNCVARIDAGFLRELKDEESRKKRISLAAAKYCEKFDDLTEAHPRPQVILLPIDDRLLSLCKESSLRIDKIVYARRDFGESESEEPELFDFHNYLKAQAAVRSFTTQMIIPKTLAFAQDKQTPSLIAWNFSVGMYYKATGIPWKLADIEEDTCYVGISFYHEISEKSKIMRASIAQVYMRTGESQVIRGKPFEWDEEQQRRNVQLTAPQMAEVIRDSIEIFSRQRNRNPRRLVVHKSTRFSDEELEGCELGSRGVDELDIIHIRGTGFRAYHEKYDYPVVRGTTISDTDELMLFSSGYVPALATYPGSSAPRPLHITCQRLDTSVESISQDIMGLTKLDWNSSTFYKTIPVTIGASIKVGAVMAELVSKGLTPPTSYRFYM